MDPDGSVAQCPHSVTGGYVSAGDASGRGSYASRTTCVRLECVSNAARWVCRQTGLALQDATYRKFGPGQDPVPVLELVAADGLTKKVTQLAGHGLADEGAAFSLDGYRVNPRGTGGLGRGLCACGEMSALLDSGHARKQWHAEHKDQTKRALTAERSAP